MRRVAGQQDPPGPVAFGLAGFEGEAREPVRLFHGQFCGDSPADPPPFGLAKHLAMAISARFIPEHYVDPELPNAAIAARLKVGSA
ncbi:hypothetical protein [Nonomuraea sp. NPDC049158]|uniref:hypothetical protein n=1 Tax=Nonomuraea sp. NPDC049158 TaxID=3155649 RepID=UPI0033DA900C